MWKKGGGKRDRVLTAQTDTAYEPDIHDPAMTETRRAEIDPDGCRRHDVPPAGLIGQEAHHEILQ